jgi:hypothetical protein
LGSFTKASSHVKVKSFGKCACSKQTLSVEERSGVCWWSFSLELRLLCVVT